MLEEYKEKQKLAYNLFSNSFANGSISHAYLIDDNNSGDASGIVYSFIKEILCHNHNEKECINICSLIDNGNYPELKVVKPDGLLIKKGQLLELQQAFSKSSIYGDKKIYIIYDCDKMRAEAANSLLKFLEEPDSSIIAFLITNNFNNVLPTIISRCQIVKLNANLSCPIDNNLNEHCLNFIKYVLDNGIDSIIHEKKIWFDTIINKDRDMIVQAIDILITMYYDVLKVSYGKKDNLSYQEYLDDYLSISSDIGKDKILTDINFLIDAKDSVKNNVNINLLVDSIIIKLGGKYECSRC